MFKQIVKAVKQWKEKRRKEKEDFDRFLKDDTYKPEGCSMDIDLTPKTRKKHNEGFYIPKIQDK